MKRVRSILPKIGKPFDSAILRDAKERFPSGYMVTGLSKDQHKPKGVISEVIGSYCKTVIYGRIGKSDKLLVLWKNGEWVRKGARMV